jgi:phosphoglycolate phosphatase-like HAD superfamily hydrolase
MNDATVYALDFDGVICDSAIETGISGWKAAGRVWLDMPETTPLEMIELFRQVRPLIETGYEAILTMRMLYLGETVASIYQGFADKSERLMQEAQVDSEFLKKLFGNIRDAWIAEDKIDWIQQNPLFPGVAEKLARLNQHCTWYVLTTKQERFVKKILSANQIELQPERIFGLDRQMSKAQVMKILRNRHSGLAMHFYEDRLPALLKIQQEPELAQVQLFFAAWGYNCDADKAQATAQGFAQHQLVDFLV